ncbi:hypothetical protein ARMGADRAFT_1136613 [Armillaria gallica]|uniref:hAT-like transposase RNase-H fold domain-containing protein n=1 Tax=Armillaria gallica TaxID=47427 RepID=A0A2H3CKX3_ARMGA|nr:hypothetical protein ARMGADRAFT_1136613 [Armillaria gallica]
MADQDNGLRDYELSRSEWEIVKDLCDMLQVLKDATLYFSRSTPSLATVIPAMDHIDTVLATAALDDVKFSAPIRAALAVAKDTLNIYYDKTDQSRVYHIAMVLHPRRKLTYFHDAGWPTSWINEAHELVVKEFEMKYWGRELSIMEVDAEVQGETSKIFMKVHTTNILFFSAFIEILF